MPHTILDVLASRELRQRDTTAYRFLSTGDIDGTIEEVSFGALVRRARAVGSWLQENGFQGHRALLLYPPGLEFVDGFFGCMVSGVVAVPAPAPHGGQLKRALPRLRAMISDAEAAVVLTTRQVISAMSAVGDEFPELARLAWVATEEIPDEAEASWRDAGIRPEDLAFLQYTSGSTSAPRGVMVSHGNLLHNQQVIASAMGHTPERVAAWGGELWLSWLPTFHDMGLIGPVMQAVYAGGTTTLFPPFSFIRRPERWLTAISKYQPHTSGAPNFAYELCLRHATPELLDRLDLRRWEVAFNGAEPVRATTLRRFAEIFGKAGFRPEAFFPAYGLAEATLMVTGSKAGGAPGPDVHDSSPGLTPATRPAQFLHPDLPGSRELVSTGRPGDGMTVVIADPERCSEITDEQVGEIWVAGPSVARGYWRQEQATKDVFHAALDDGRAGFLRTGDLGFLRGGELFVTGRLKDLLVIDGRNHYPQDLELSAERAHSAIRPGGVAAFSVDGHEIDGAGGEQPVVVAEVPPSKAATDADEICAAIRGAVGSEHGLSLRSVVLVAPGGVPKTSSGKLQRSACRAAFLQGTLRVLGDTSGTPGEMPAEEPPNPEMSAEAVRSWLMAAVAEQAEVDPARVDVDRPIADLGLGSMALVRLSAKLSDLLGRELEPGLFFDHPTIALASQAVHLRNAAAPVPVRPRAMPTDAVAIISMGCHFPGGADDPQGLWRLLTAETDAVAEVPADRWDTDGLYDPDPEAAGRTYTLRGGFLADIDRFDAAFFGISPREAAAMDPQQRLLLQTCWETIERAGIVPGQLNGTSTGVYIGLYDSGYSAGVGLDQLNGHVGTGSAASVASGRIAYALGLHGPAMTVDTACSSSLVAVHLAAQALRNGECDLALAGGATLMVTPRAHVEFSRVQVLSKSGGCKPFSAAADGIAWAEGCGLVLLKRLSDAVRDGDRVLAVVRGSAVNQDGRSQGLTAPNSLAQERVVRAALDAAGLAPEDLDFVEAHGTGTPLGDPIELRALARVFGPDRPPGRPLAVGSLKSNLGHTQAAAGIAGVIKTVLAMQHHMLPASLHADPLTDQFDWSAGGLEVIGRSQPWTRGSRARRAGVSSFGISGTNAHVILEEAPPPPGTVTDPGGAAEPTDQDAPGHGGDLFPLSARSLTSLRGQAARLQAALAAAPDTSLPDLARTLAHHRTHFEHRAVVVAGNREDLLAGLGTLAFDEVADGSAQALVAGPGEALGSGKLAFVCPGQGQQWVGMGRELLLRSGVFRQELERCDAALRPHTGWSVVAVLRGEAAAPPLQKVEVVQPALFAVMVSLAAVWRARGLEPDAVVGHSQGEVAAACIAGALSLSDAAAVAALRSQALSAVAGTGSMAVVGLPHGEVEARLVARGGRVCVAAVNSARSTVVAGDHGPLDALLTDLERDEVHTRWLSVENAGHSPHVEPVRERLLADLAGIAAGPASVPWYSTVTTELLPGQCLPADYWYRNLRQPVRFGDTVERMIADGFGYFVELSAHPTLTTAVRTVADDAGKPVVAVGSLRRQEDALACLEHAVAELHVGGRTVDVGKALPGRLRTELPTYAWDAQRYWLKPAATSSASGLALAEHPLLGAQMDTADATRLMFRKSWSARSPEWLRGHTLFGETVVPATTMLELCRAALAAARPDQNTDVTDVSLSAPLVLPASGLIDVQVEVARLSSEALPRVSVYSRPQAATETGWTLHATAGAGESAGLAAGSPPEWPDGAAADWGAAGYARLADAGLVCGPAFRSLDSVMDIGDGAVVARLSLPAQARNTAEAYPVHPVVLDAALHAVAASDPSGRVLLPVAVGRCTLEDAGGAQDLLACVRRTGSIEADLMVDVTLWDDDGLPVGRLEQVRMRAATRADLLRGTTGSRHLYEVSWLPVPAAPVPSEGSWVLLADPAHPLAEPLRRALAATGAQVSTAATAGSLPTDAGTVIRLWSAGDAHSDMAAGVEQLTATGMSELQSLLAAPHGQAPSGVVWVTQGAVAADPGDLVPGLAQSGLWGLARSARAEHPDLGLRVIDIDETASPHDLLSALGQVGEPELAIRGGALRAPRLAHASLAEPERDRSAAEADGAAPVVAPGTAQQVARVPDNGTVLITGGLGALGMHIARWLARNGVKHLLLTSRRGLADPRCAEVRAELSTLGAAVTIAACDAADAAAVRSLLSGIDSHMPLRGVVHCAGALADGVLTQQTPTQLAAVMHPKAAGAAHLHQLTADTPLDLFLLVSSAAGVLGSAGQSNYAAANAFLDQLAHHRRALGLPASSLSFGVWAGGGLADGHADLQRMADHGYPALTPDEGCDLVEAALLRSAPHLLACKVDHARLREGFARDGEVPGLWRFLVPSAEAGPARSGLTERLARLPETERADRVRGLVSREVARVLRLRPGLRLRSDQPLRELGMDSLMAVEIRNRIATALGARLPVSLAFDHPTVEQLTAHLLSAVIAPASAPALTRRAAAAPLERTALDEPLAVVSMACRLPGGINDPEGLWQLLSEGRDAIGALPLQRWGVQELYDPDPRAAGRTTAREGGFLHDIDAFDPAFFGITGHEASAMDPQQRLLLETAWEALERAGIVPATLAGSDTGVYVGMFGSGYLAEARLDERDGYVGIGSALSVASGRLAYTLGLRGPAVSVETACSSSLVALHLAAQALRNRECDLALAGGVTVMVTPHAFVEFSRLGGLASSGRCRSFSDDADGTGWAEGAAMVLLKRLSDARRDGDQVLAVLRGTAINQDGRSQGLTAPNGPSQEQVIRRALDASGLAPADIDYVEAHGTGTTLGDPIEANALSEVFGRTRTPGRPLWLGSLKSNIGHPQAAAGIAGLIKVVLSLQAGQLPRTLHADTPSRHVDWDHSGLRLVREPQHWPSGERPRRAGVSAFGISGTNAHVIVEEAPTDLGTPQRRPAHGEPEAAVQSRDHRRQLLVLSARSASALRRQASRLAEHITTAAEVGAGAPALRDVAYTLACHRSHFERRAALLAADRSELLEQLQALAANRPHARVSSPSSREVPPGKVAFVFGGHGGQWTGMAKDLLTCPDFAEEVARCDEAIRRHTGWSVLAVLRGDAGAPDPERVDVVQPLLFTVGAGLAAMWRSLGVDPDAVVGHSVGEIAAAYTAGLLTLDTAAALVARRARSLVPLAGRGGLLAVELTAESVEAHLSAYTGRLCVAALNSAGSTVVSGDLDALTDLQEQLTAQNVHVRRVPIAFASHSPQMEAVREDLVGQLAAISGTDGKLPLYSTVLGEAVEGSALGPDYWYRNLREPVRFAAAVQQMVADGYRNFVEISPHPTLRPAIESVAADAGVEVVSVGSLRRGEDGHEAMLHQLGRLYTGGCMPDWQRAYPSGVRVDLPTYAFDRERYWRTVAPSLGATGAWPLAGVHVEPSDGSGLDIFQTEIGLRDSRFSYLADHRITGAVWLPGAAFLEMALEAATRLGTHGPVQLAEVAFEQPLQLPSDAAVRLQMVVQPTAADGSRRFTIASRTVPDGGGSGHAWLHHVAGRIEPAGTGENSELLAPDVSRARCTDEVDLPGMYETLAAAGIDFGPSFRRLEEGRRGPRSAVGRLAESARSPYLLHPALLDAALQTVALLGEAPAGTAFVPAGVRQVRFTGLRTQPVWVTCRLDTLQDDTAVLDLQLFDESEELVLDVQGFALAALSRLDRALFEVQWQPAPTAQNSPARGSWLIMADDSGVGEELSRRLGAAPHVIACAGEEFRAEAAGRYVLDPTDPAHLARLLDEAFPDAPPEQVVHLLALDAPAIDTPDSAATAERLCCLSTLQLVRALSSRAPDWHPRLFLVTRACQPAQGSAEVTCPQQALGWGFGTAVAQEQPQLTTTLIDLPPTGGVDALWAELHHADEETLVALRDSGRWVPRLARTRPEHRTGATIRTDGTYLVTGGLGGLGRVAAERLAAQGARHLALLGRSAPTPDATAWLTNLREQGIAVHVLRADVADRTSLGTALETLRRQAPPVTGIIHTAGVLHDATLPNVTAEGISEVLAPKVLGTLWLTELVPDTDFLLLFSSAAALFGSAGQSAYCAANAFLDAWAHHLTPTGRRALSLNWGAWAEVGMIAESATRTAAINRSELTVFSPQEGGALFERILFSGRRQLAPLALDEHALARNPEQTRTRPLLRGLIGSPAQRQSSHDLVRQVLAAATEPEQIALLEDYVRDTAQAIAGGDMTEAASTAPLKELGFDSLMLVTLRNTLTRDLGVELPTSAVFTAGTSDLARALRTAVLERGTPPPTVNTVTDAPDAAPDGATPGSRPATRDVIRMLRTEQQGTPSQAHHLGLAVRLKRRCTHQRLEGILTRLAQRHAALRMAVLDSGEHNWRLKVQREPSNSLQLRSSTPDGDVERRLRELMEPPFDLATPPLWRFELLESDTGEQTLIFGAHHSVADAQSLLLVVAGIDAELSGTTLGAATSDRSDEDIDSLLRAQPPGDSGHPGPGMSDWLAQFSGCRRLELAQSAPRPQQRSFRAGHVFLTIPAELLKRVQATASRLAITPASFCLGALTALLAQRQHTDRFVLAVPVDTRVHADAFDALGFFGIPAPFPAKVTAGEPIGELLRRTDTGIEHLLGKGATFADTLPSLLAEGLYRENAPLVEVYFNYLRWNGPVPTHLEIIPAGTGYSDLDLMITVLPDLSQLRLDHSLDILDETACRVLGEDYLRLLGEAADDPNLPVHMEPRPTPPAPRGTPEQRCPSIALAATFALGRLPALCESALSERPGTGEPAVVEAPYHHVLAALCDPAGVFTQASTTAGVVLLRAADLTRFGDLSDELLAELAQDYPATLQELSERTRMPLIVGFLPSPTADDRLEQWQSRVMTRLQDLPGVAVLRPHDWTRDYPVEDLFDHESDRLAHLPFTPQFQAAVALTLADVVHAVRRTPPKVIAVDGDNTLWGGVAGEIGTEAVDLTGPHARLARKLLQWRAAGTLLVLLSNNDEETVRAVLARPDSILHEEHFSLISAGWDRKSDRLRTAAQDLRLGLDTFVFLDDNHVETAAMRAAVPEVLSVTCPAADELESFLARLWPLVPLPATAEDATRAQFYEQERKRDSVRVQARFADFLEQLELDVEIQPLSEHMRQRSEQLLRRVTQFTLRPPAQDGSQLERWQADGDVWSACARDRFGDYGQIGLLAVRPDGNVLEVLGWVLSCRALGRGVEERLLRWLADHAEELGCSAVRLGAEHTPRNTPARRLVAAVGGGDAGEDRLEVVAPVERLRTFRSWEN